MRDCLPIPMALIRDKHVTHQQAIVFALIVHESLWHATNIEIGEICELDPTAVSRALSALVRQNLLKITFSGTRALRDSNVNSRLEGNGERTIALTPHARTLF